MGVQEDDVVMLDVGPSEQERTEPDVKLDTVVLPEGVCLLDRAFAIIEKDPDGKKFDKVSRFICRCSNASLDLMLDVNIDVYPLKAIYRQQTLMDEFEYVCFGRVFKVKDAQDSKLQVLASFGGLIMRLLGDPNLLDKFQIDQEVYLLVRAFKPAASKKPSAKRPLDSIHLS